MLVHYFANDGKFAIAQFGALQHDFKFHIAVFIGKYGFADIPTCFFFKNLPADFQQCAFFFRYSFFQVFDFGF